MATIEELEGTVFFVTRIGSDDSVERIRSDDLMELILVPAVQEFDDSLKVVRADQMAAHGRITDGIIQHLIHSAFVVVDTTGRNPNVYFELGVAHAFHKKVILIVDSAADLPFDTRSEAHIVVPGEGRLLARDVNASVPRLVEALHAARAATSPTGPVASAQGQIMAPDLSKDEATDLLRTSIRDMQQRLEALESEARRRGQARYTYAPGGVHRVGLAEASTSPSLFTYSGGAYTTQDIGGPTLLRLESDGGARYTVVERGSEPSGQAPSE